MGATYFPFTVRSSSLRLGCGQKHKPITIPQLLREAVAANSTDHPTMRSLLSDPGPAPSARKRNRRSPGLQPHVPAQVHRPTRKRSVRRAGQRSPAQRTAKAWRAAQAAAASPCWADERAGERAGARRGGRGTRGATGPLRGRGAARALPPRTCVGGSPRSRSGRVGSAPPSAPNLLNSRSGRRASGPAGHGTGRAHDAAEGPTWRSPGAAREAERASAPARSQRVPGGADAEAPQLTTSSGRGSGGGGGGGSRQPSALWAGELAARGRAGGQAQAVDRTNRRAQQPKELEPEQAGLRRPSPGQRPRRARLPSAPLHLQRSPGLWRGAGSCAGPPPGALRVADASGNFMEVSPVLSGPPLPPDSPSDRRGERVGRGKQRSLRLRQGATD